MDMIHHIAATKSYAVSAYDVWRPGSFDSERAAKYARYFSDSDLRQMQDIANEDNNGHITFDHMKAWREAKKHIQGPEL